MSFLPTFRTPSPGKYFYYVSTEAMTTRLGELGLSGRQLARDASRHQLGPGSKR